MLHSIDHVNLVVTDLNRAIEFFTLLGFEVLHQGDLEGEWISRIVGLEAVQAHYVSLGLPQSQTKLELIHYHRPAVRKDPDIRQANGQGFRHIAFRVSDLDAVYAKLEAAGVEFLSEIQIYEVKQKKLVYFYGPEGILLELAEYGN